MKKLTIEKFIKEAKLIHKDRYDYSLVRYKNCETKVKIICKEHGVFLQNKIHHVNRSQGCPFCSGNVLLTTKEFIEKAKLIHNNKYDYSEVKYINSKTKIKIICKKHGKFNQLPYSHLNGNECKLCSIEKMINKKTYSFEQFVKKAIKTHGIKYIYNDYNKASKKVKILCKKCEKYFFQTPNNHISKQYGCPLCSSSKGEDKIISYLKENYIDFIKEKKFDDCINPRTGHNLKYDFFIPNINLLIEFDGIQHFNPIKIFGGEKNLKERIYKDNIKNQYAKEKKIKLLRIPYYDINNIKETLNRKIKWHEV